MIRPPPRSNRSYTLFPYPTLVLSRYAFARALASGLESVPRGVRRAVAGAIHAVPPSSWDRLFGYPASSRIVPAHPGDKLHKLAGIIGTDADALYLGLVSQWPDPCDVVPGGVEPDGPLNDGAARGLVAARSEEHTSELQSLMRITYALFCL